MEKGVDEPLNLSDLAHLLNSNATCAGVLNEWISGSLDPTSLFNFIDQEICGGRLDKLVGKLFKDAILQHGGFSATNDGYLQALRSRHVFAIQGGRHKGRYLIIIYKYFMLYVVCF